MISRAAARWLALAMVALGIGLSLGELLLFLLAGAPPDAEPLDVVASIEFGAAPMLLAPLAGIIATRRPAHPVGWLLGAMAASVGLSQFSQGYAQYALLNNPGVLPFGEAAAWVANSTWPLDWIPMLLLLLVFPTGRLLARPWRAAACGAVIVPVLSVVLSAIIPGPLHITETLMSSFDNPTGVWGFSPELAAQLWTPLFLIELGLLLVAVVSLGFRFRHARGTERQQLKLLFYATVIFLGCQVLAQTGLAGKWAQLLVNIASNGITVAMALALLRYRLFEIDRIINRTLVYGLLTVFLAACYWIGVVVLQQLLRPITQGSDLAIVGSTLAVAALFQPLRHRIQQGVDRRFYRQRYDAVHTLEAFSARLRHEVDLDSLGGELLAVVHQTMQPDRLSLWLRPPTARKSG